MPRRAQRGAAALCSDRCSELVFSSRWAYYANPLSSALAALRRGNGTDFLMNSLGRGALRGYAPAACERVTDVIGSRANTDSPE